MKRIFNYVKQSVIDSPYPQDPRKIYRLLIDVNELPEGLPTEVNPRNTNMKTNVAKKIAEGLLDNDTSFFIHNRGILISAKHVNLDTINKQITLDIGNGTEEDLSLYGVLDGGHTYKAILDNRDYLAADNIQYVNLEIITHIENIDLLAAARNTSVQVSDKAIAELADKFEFIKDALANESYIDDISYRENEGKRLDTVDFVRLMFAFNVYKYNEDSVVNKQPIQAYSGKAQVLKDYLKEYENPNNPYKKLAPLLPKIVELYGVIETEMSKKYLNYTPSGKFGKIKGITSSKSENNKKQQQFHSKFTNKEIDYQISQGFIFPILSSFRALLEDKDGTVHWVVDPIDIWNKIGAKLVSNTVDMSRELGNNPQSAGKSTTLWSQNFDAVNTAKLQAKLSALQG